VTYSAFGAMLSETGTSPNRLKYTGREDDGTGLYYYRARYYDPEIGRFISEDPLGFGARDVNFYAYVGNNPVNGNDPSGLDTIVSLGYTKTPIPGAYHQLAILTDTVTGQAFATRGGPAVSSGNGGSGGYGFGQIEAVAAAFDTQFKDLPSKLVDMQYVGTIGRDFADSVGNAMEFANITNQNQIPYWPLGLNSNSYASTFVESLTGTRPTPILTAPSADYGRPSSSLSYTPSSFVNSAAGGGFVLYPNKPNTNMMQAVYAK
jgi:RHS repeat-associated protein